MRIGVIGLGNMGGMLAWAFAQDADAEVYVNTRTYAKALALAQASDRIHAVPSATELARRCDVIFLCTKADDARQVMQDIGPMLKTRQMLATTVSSIPLCEWHQWTDAQVVKTIPSVLQSVGRGAILVTYSPRFQTEAQEEFESLLSRIGDPFEVMENQVRVCSDMTSCGPAFIAVLLQEWARAAAETGKVSVGEAEYLLSKTLMGTAALLASGSTLSDIIRRVTVPGGVTEKGSLAMKDKAHDLFCTVHAATEQHAHYAPATEKSYTPSTEERYESTTEESYAREP